MLTMPKFIIDLYNKTEQLKGKKLIYIISACIVISVILGIVIGNFTNKILNKNEVLVEEMVKEVETVVSNKYEGLVTYVDPRLYPGLDISYALTDIRGNQIILLKSEDQTLAVVEGLNVILFGDVDDTLVANERVLLVDKVLVKNK